MSGPYVCQVCAAESDAPCGHYVIIVSCELALLDLTQRVAAGEVPAEADDQLVQALIHTLKNVRVLGWETSDYVSAVAHVMASPLLQALREASAGHRQHDPSRCADSRLLQAVAALERWYWDGRTLSVSGGRS